MLTKEQLELMAEIHRKGRELHNILVEAGLADGSYEDALAKKTNEVITRMMNGEE